VYIDDIFVKTSTRKMRLEAEVTVVNATEEPQTVGWSGISAAAQAKQRCRCGAGG